MINYLIFFSAKKEKLNSLSKNSESISLNISKCKKELKEINKIKNENLEDFNNLKINTINNYNEKNFLEFKENFPYIEESEKNFKVCISNENLKELKNISNFYIFNDFYLSKSEKHILNGNINFYFDNKDILKDNFKEKEKINLEKYYFYKDKKSNNINIKDKKISKEIKDINKKEQTTEIVNDSKRFSLRSSYKDIMPEDILIFLDKSLSLEFEYFLDVNIYKVILNNNIDDINLLLVLLNEDFEDIKEISFELYLDEKNICEFGAFNGSKNKYTKDLEENKWNEVVIKDIENLEGLYILVNNFKASFFYIRNLKVLL